LTSACRVAVLVDIFPAVRKETSSSGKEKGSCTKGGGNHTEAGTQPSWKKKDRDLTDRRERQSTIRRKEKENFLPAGEKNRRAGGPVVAADRHGKKEKAEKDGWIIRKNCRNSADLPLDQGV